MIALAHWRAALCTECARRKLIEIKERIFFRSRCLSLKRQCEGVLIKPPDALSRLRAEHFDLLLLFCFSTPADEAFSLIRIAQSEFPSVCPVRLVAVN